MGIRVGNGQFVDSCENKKALKLAQGLKIYGASGRTRTDDLRFTKPLLYQLSYVSNSNVDYTRFTEILQAAKCLQRNHELGRLASDIPVWHLGGCTPPVFESFAETRAL